MVRVESTEEHLASAASEFESQDVDRKACYLPSTQSVACSYVFWVLPQAITDMEFRVRKNNTYEK